MNKQQFVLCIGFMALLGCAADDKDASPKTGTAGVGGSTVDVKKGKCTTPGTQSCFCGDGAASGSQTCNTDGSLSPCLCVPAGGGGGVAGTGDPGTAPLCADLADATGCMAKTFQSAELPASILFVVDRSGSMNCNLPPTQTSEDCEMVAKAKDATMPTKWQVTTAALKNAFKSLADAESSASVGLTFFSNDNQCGGTSKPTVGISPLTKSSVMTLESVLDATMPGGGTPIVGATILAYQHIHEEAGAGIECPGPMCPCAKPPCGAGGNRYIVLITDGQESCAAGAEELANWQTQLLDTEAPKAVKANVRTFVVGSPGSEPSRGFLSELAFQGGTASNPACKHDRKSAEGDCHFDMTKTTDFAADLAAVLKSISGAALSCQFSVPTALDDNSANNVNVQLTKSGSKDPQCFARDDSKACSGGANGWQFAKLPDGKNDLTKVVLCGDACNQVMKDPGARVDVLVGCESINLE